jgi:hypothetical protein
MKFLENNICFVLHNIVYTAPFWVFLLSISFQVLLFYIACPKLVYNEKEEVQQMLVLNMGL